MDYCNPQLCRICNYEVCTVRTDDHTLNVKWDIDKMIGEPVYKEFHIT